MPVSVYNCPWMAYQLPLGTWPLFGEKETTAVAFTAFCNPKSLERKKTSLFLKIGTKSKKSIAKETAPNWPHQLDLCLLFWHLQTLFYGKEIQKEYTVTCFECHTGYLTKKIAHFNILFFSCNIIINIEHESKRQSLKNDYYLRFVDKSYTFFLFVFHMGTLTWKLLCSLCAERRGWRGRKTHRLSSSFHLSHY